MVCETHPESPADRCGASPGNIAEWAGRSRTIEAMGLARDWPFMVLEEGRQRSVAGGVIASSLFQVFGVVAERGRLLLPEDSEPGRELVAVVTHAFWQSRLGGAEDVVGRRIRLDADSRTIVGVLPAGFDVPRLGRVEIWIPIWPDRRENHGWRGFRSYGRLAPGVSLEQARSEMESIRAEIEPLYPDSNRGWGVVVDSLRDRTVREVRPVLLIFLGAVGLVLLIACANVANLLLAQSSSREKEFVMRAALGAGPGVLVRQVLVESLCLALMGGGLGWIVSGWATESLLAAAPANIPRLQDVRMDGPVLAFCFALSAATSLLFGLVPALQTSRPSFEGILREGRHTLEHRGGARARSLLVVAEVGMATVMLVGAGLLIRSFVNLNDWQPGFDRRNLVFVQVFCSPGKYREAEQVADLFPRMEEGLRAVPGVIAAGAASAVPLLGGDGNQEFSILGRPEPPPGQRPSVYWYDVGSQYFRTMGIPLIRGRSLTDADDGRSPSVAIVNETMARRWWPDGNPIGQRIALAASRTTVEIVGVVGDVQPFRPDRPPEPEIYWPFRQAPRWGTMFAIRTTSDPGAATQALRARLQEIEPDVDVGRFVTLEELEARELVQPRFNMLLLGLLAGLALFLASIGVYGVLSYSIAQRSHEIGVRLAFGADRNDVVRLLVAGGMRWAVGGAAAGLAASIPLMLLLRRLLVNVGPADPATLIGVAILLLIVALAACLVPALRATRADPMSALRCE
jgi:putative ABC transport system permease protein